MLFKSWVVTLYQNSSKTILKTLNAIAHITYHGAKQFPVVVAHLPNDMKTEVLCWNGLRDKTKYTVGNGS